MQIWLDTVNLKVVEDGVNTGLIAGITTNPTILSQTKNVRDTLKQLLSMQPGPVAVQVTSQDVNSMVEEGRHIAGFSERMIVKVPVNQPGLAAMRQLIALKIPVLGTAVVHPSQALQAAILGTSYIAPYCSQMTFDDLKTIYNLLKTNNFPAKLLAASLKTIDEIIACSLIGINAITIKDDLYTKLTANHDLAEKYLHKFKSDWHQAHGTASIKEVLGYVLVENATNLIVE